MSEENLANFLPHYLAASVVPQTNAPSGIGSFDVDIKNLAPFTHDAGTTNRPLILPPAAPASTSTPEPTSLAGLFALLGSLAALRRK